MISRIKCLPGDYVPKERVLMAGTEATSAIG
jgi:hypothetical protein